MKQLQPLRKENDLMKTTLKKIIGGATLGLALLAHTGPTWAGVQFNPQVFVFNSSAEGSMNGARYSSDTKQQIGCRLYATPTFSNVFCAAIDSTGAQLSCFSTDAQLMAAASSITDSSFIRFRTFANTECSDIEVINSSAHLR
jgi:hypothetical protein